MFNRFSQLSFQAAKRSSSQAPRMLQASALMMPSMMLQPTQMFALPARNFAYHERVIDHYENPRNVGSLDKKDPTVGTGLVGAPACGDVMKLQIKVNEENGTIEKAVFKTFGCGSAIASSSYATELLEGMAIEEAVKIKNQDIFEYSKK